jgi:hypothetical protein
LVVKPEEEEADEIEIEALCANIFLYAFVCVCVSGSAKVSEIAFRRFFCCSFDARKNYRIERVSKVYRRSMRGFGCDEEEEEEVWKIRMRV